MNFSAYVSGFATAMAFVAGYQVYDIVSVRRFPERADYRRDQLGGMLALTIFFVALAIVMAHHLF